MLLWLSGCGCLQVGSGAPAAGRSRRRGWRAGTAERRDGGHGGRAPGVQVPLRAGGLQLPPKDFRRLEVEIQGASSRRRLSFSVSSGGSSCHQFSPGRGASQVQGPRVQRTCSRLGSTFLVVEYPNPMDKNVLSVKIVEEKRDVSTGIIYRKRIAVCQNVIPEILRKHPGGTILEKGEHFKDTQYPVRRGIMAQSSGKKHGYTESLPYMDTIRIHEGRVCLPGKCGKSKLGIRIMEMLLKEQCGAPLAE
ncbi:PRELI domain-containing protein 2 isoform X3 [Loxodonta africana]|uniref:PRELI domain-containing protein 2 isoform X3 n=1 Tax=Loxodonta africana TaxID=9785 RepID=UPI0030D210E9